MSKHLSRKSFLQLTAAGLGAVAGGQLLAACGPAPTATPAPTNTPLPTDTPAPTNTPAPTAMPLPTAPPVPPIKFFPDTLSRVVHTHHAGAWQGDNLVPAALGQMLDSSITKLTGLKDAPAAWAALFKSTERIAIKVNVFRNSLIWTHWPLVKAVADRLQAAGVPAEQITIFDYYTSELETAKYPVNPDGPGVRCYGTDDKYTNRFKVDWTEVGLSDVVMNCDALINMPVLKSHMIAGLTFALKNHYGSIDMPESLHGVSDCIPALNALPPIKERTRLIIGDMLAANLQYSSYFPYWEEDYRGDSILMSFDPLAHDTVGMNWISKLITDKGDNPGSLQGMAADWLKNAGEAGLGANDLKNIELIEEKLA